MMHPKRYTTIPPFKIPPSPPFAKGGRWGFLEKGGREGFSDEKGMVLVVGLMLIVVLALLGTTAVLMSTTDMKISANYKTSNQAFYVAEAGIEEARARLKTNDPPDSNEIADLYPTDTGWSAYIGDTSKSQSKGYNSGNSKHVRVSSLQSALDYTVKIVHKRNSPDNMTGDILYWGDADGNGVNERTTSPTSPTGLANQNIYLVTSYGSASGANRVIEVEMARVPPLTVPGALYVEAPTTILGKAGIFGVDQCCVPPNPCVSVPGVVTTLADGTVNPSNNPDSKITGSTSPTGEPDPSIVGDAMNMDIQAMINSQKEAANFVYNVASATHTGSTTPGPGDGWGTPTPALPPDSLQKPSSCNAKNIVYYNTWNGSNFTDIKLAGGTTGCGILLVEGDIDINGGFSWHGLVIVSGSVKYTGGGDKNITGGVLAGGSATADVVGGNTYIVYCSSAIDDQTKNQPLRNLSWMDKI